MRNAEVEAGTVAEFLQRLGARTPTPAGGSVAALCVAQAAALVAMVARYCDAPPLAEQAERLVSRAQELVVDDERAFGAVAAGWALPRGTDQRRSVIDEALRCKEEGTSRVILFNLCGHGHFDMAAYSEFAAGRLTDASYAEGELAMALAGLPSMA